MDSLGLIVNIHRFRDKPGRASVYLYGSDLSCCYFVDAARSIAVDPREPLSRVPFLADNQRGGICFLKTNTQAPSILNSARIEISVGRASTLFERI